MENKMVITPKTKILDLITEYPQLEAILFDISPAFRQLKNPVLRKTVARVTTLQQAAIVGKIKVEDLVNLLRLNAGHHPVETDNYPSPLDPSPLDDSPEDQPDWFSIEKVKHHLDAREMLNRGEHPVGQVLADLQAMPADDIYELVAPFHPAPLIDKAANIGFANYVVEIGPEEYRVFFIRR